MRVLWTAKAVDDLQRLYRFLIDHNPHAALSAVQKLVKAPDSLLSHARMGAALPEFAPREVRRLLIGRYEVRYEISGDAINILRVWHAREDR